MYTTTINQNGMILLNKAAREALGVKLGDRVMISFDKKSARVERRMSDKEFLDGIERIHTKYGSNQKNEIDATEAVELYRSGKTAKLKDYYKEKYL